MFLVKLKWHALAVCCVLALSVARANDPPPRDWITVSAQRTGQLVLVAPKEGDRVKEGELLARIDDRLARTEAAIRMAKVAAVEADRAASEKTRDEAKVRYERMLRIQKGGAVSEEEVTAAKLTLERYIEEVRARDAAVKVARLEAEQAQVLVQMHEIRSPVNGTIQKVLYRQGESVKDQKGVFRIKIDQK